MRIDELRLDRFGFHVGRSLTFPAPAGGVADLHIVAGDNGTGKSSICVAIADLLFGFPHLTRWAIGYEPTQLHLGAQIRDRSGRTLDFNRSKHRRDNLATPDGKTIDEAHLRSMIGGADRRNFENLYALDQLRLRKGGEEMLKAKSDVGETIFAAASGIATLSEIRDSLKSDLDAIGTARRSAERPVWKAEQNYRDAVQRAADSALRAEEWLDADQARQRAEAALAGLNRESGMLEEERTRIDRLIRVFPILQDLGRLLAEADSLKAVRLLAQDFPARWTEAVLQHDRACAALDRANAIYAKRKDDRQSLATTAGVLPEFSREIEALNTKIGSIDDLIRDLSKLERDQDKVEKRLQALAGNLGGKAEDVVRLTGLMPSQAIVGHIREMLIEHNGLATALGAARESEKKESEALRQARAELEALGEPKEPKRASALMQAARNVETDMKKLLREKQAFAASERTEKAAIGALKGWSGSPEELLVAIFPSAVEIADVKSRIEKAERAVETARDKVLSIEEEISRIDAEDWGAVSSVPTTEEVSDGRLERDRRWRGIRASAASGEDVASDTLDGFENSIRSADKLIDQRLDGADQVAQQKRIETELAGKRRQLGRARAVVVGAEEALALEKAGAIDLWKETLFQGMAWAPPAMAIWLAGKEKAVDAIQSRLAAAEEMEHTQTTLTAGISALRQVAEELGLPPAGSLDELVAVEALATAARQALVHAQETWARSGQMTAEIRRREAALQKAAETIGDAEQSFTRWGKSWADAMPAIGLATEAKPASAKERLDHWAAFAEEASLHATIDGRLEGIRHHLSGHRQAIENLTAKIGGTFDGAPTEDEWREWPAFLYRHLVAARALGEAIAHADKVLRDAETERSDAGEGERSTSVVLKKLRDEARIDDSEDVGGAIEESRRRRENDVAIGERRRAFMEASDGIDEAVLKIELEGKSRADLVHASLENKAARDKILVDVQEAAANQQQCRSRLRELEERTGHGLATHQAYSHAAEVGQLTKRWMRVTAARVILDATIERYRQQHEGPLVKRAGEVFIGIAGNQAPDFFTRLEIDYTKPNDPHLIVLRASGTAARVEELSEGTRDQLWLAFRIAALERRAEEAEPMPFLADDLFASSDGTRTETGLRYLLELARSTQVILFTHHDYVVSAAKKHLPGISIQELKREAVLSVVA